MPGSYAAKSDAGHGGRKAKSSWSATIELMTKADWGHAVVLVDPNAYADVVELALG